MRYNHQKFSGPSWTQKRPACKISARSVRWKSLGALTRCYWNNITQEDFRFFVFPIAWLVLSGDFVPSGPQAIMASSRGRWHSRARFFCISFDALRCMLEIIIRARLQKHFRSTRRPRGAVGLPGAQNTPPSFLHARAPLSCSGAPLQWMILGPRNKWNMFCYVNFGRTTLPKGCCLYTTTWPP